MKLSRVGEDALLASLLRELPASRKEIGDDCAVLDVRGSRNMLVLKTDCIVEKVHFESSAPPELVGWKAMMRPLSDFAAVSALPQFALVTLIAPATKTTSWVTRLYRGLNRAAARFDVAIVGGETSATRGPVTISVSVSGWVERNRAISRSGGRKGDDLFVTGKLGGSFSGKHLQFTPRIKESRWLSRTFRVHAMMDLSDGLGADLPRLARATVEGAGELSFQCQESTVAELRENVTSRGGTTAAALEILMAQDGLTPLIERAVKAAKQRAAALAG